MWLPKGVDLKMQNPVHPRTPNPIPHAISKGLRIFPAFRRRGRRGLTFVYACVNHRNSQGETIMENQRNRLPFTAQAARAKGIAATGRQGARRLAV